MDSAPNHARLISWEKLYYSDVVLLSFDRKRLVAESVHDDNKAGVLRFDSSFETASRDVVFDCSSEVEPSRLDR